MPSYAILGATGQTGQSLLNILSKLPDRQIHAYVRSKSKLERMSPDVCALPRVKIYEGDLNDSELIADCISGTQAVFLTAAQSDNMPGCRVACDSARILVTALGQLRFKDPTARLPRLVMLSSGTIDEHLSRDMPRFAHWMLFTAYSSVYKDLIEAEQYLRDRQDWISTTFIKPAGLVHDAQKGHQLSTEKQQSFLSFLDLAAGMIEVADAEGNQWDKKNVSVLPTGKNVKVEYMAPVYLAKGLLCHFLPSLYPYLRA
ncbi:uncharacterized protein KY384_008546 [Bacidia gigantensis]|uniref:uncharacterized protein n=1 Tax=Bacidia gigantensis TaxID=2732470 RepID=UPI001D056E12|nr:uncharacterized protein KY384_008546 [Bacidia gigantensis]KAG8527117.1 hypothetical protein KY384_008546 [Bacidia gigantensis]